MFNLMDVDQLVDAFLKEYMQGIATLHRIYFKSDNQLSLKALKEEMLDELRTGCVCFINKEDPDLEELNSCLFYIANAFCKKTAKPIVKKVTEYICPGCVYLGKDYSAILFDKVFKCDECADELKNATDPQKIYFFRTFSIHNKLGYHCIECERFIPHPINRETNIACPYFDCVWSGSINDLEKMNHPTSRTNPEKIVLDDVIFKNKITDQQDNACTQLVLAEDLQEKISKIQDVIETQTNNIIYSSSEFTVKHKQFVYKAFENLLKQYPQEMVDYLFNLTNSHYGFQHKIFQEYISLLEAALPISYTKNKKQYKVESLLDNNLKLFDGISVFDGIIDSKLNIKNETKEFYIGGRKAAYTKPYYIGKLLNVIKTDDKSSLIHLVKDYGFSKIHMRNVEPNTKVIVTHLRVPPHYQMGGMVYVNRIHKKISERLK
jgi:hypothetical protein